jgi:hypothetical protein
MSLLCSWFGHSWCGGLPNCNHCYSYRYLILRAGLDPNALELCTRCGVSRQ